MKEPCVCRGTGVFFIAGDPLNGPLRVVACACPLGETWRDLPTGTNVTTRRP